MKLLDKLASDYHNDCRYFYECTCNDAFKAGFKAARKMAEHELYDSGVDPTGYGQSQISQIGEEDVMAFEIEPTPPDAA